MEQPEIKVIEVPTGDLVPYANNAKLHSQLQVEQIANSIEEFDFLFTCPPYADLEVYSDDPADISNMPFDKFLETYEAILSKAVAKLAQDRFACIVIGDVRDKRGFYRNLPGLTVEIMGRAGAGYYNEAVLVTPAGSLPIRAGKQFEASRKLGKTHQNVLVFCKGDPRAATERLGHVDAPEFEEE